MVLSSRMIVAVGLGVAGAGLLVAPIQGQQAAQGQQDGAVRKTNADASPFQPGTPPVFGTIDLDFVFKNYEKVKYANEEFQAAYMARQGELKKLQQELLQETEVLSRFVPGQEDFRKQEDKLTQMKATFEAKREQAEREFQTREAEAMANLYNEVTEVAKKIAKARRMTYVMKVSNQIPSGANPNAVMAAMANPMIYFDQDNDISQDVVYNLNTVYKRAGGPTAKAAAPAGGAGAAPANAGGQPAAAAAAAAPKSTAR